MARPLARHGRRSALTLMPLVFAEELRTWPVFLRAYRAQDWPACERLLQILRQDRPDSVSFAPCGQRVAARREQPFDPSWDGATNFETK